MKETWILGLHVTDRVKEVSILQGILAKYGCSIKTRLGLHHTESEQRNACGIILLELTGSTEEFYKLENELLSVDGLTVRKMVFPL